jgi:hypothetical protein
MYVWFSTILFSSSSLSFFLFSAPEKLISFLLDQD